MQIDGVEIKEQEKLMAARKAVAYVKDGDIVGLGTGSTAKFAIEALGQKIKEGLQIKGVPSSLQTQVLAVEAGIPLLELGQVKEIDISIDGADEFTADLNLIKGGGGALFREKIVASLSKNRIIIVDSSKKVDKLGAFKVPVEVIPTALSYVFQQLEKLHGIGQLRLKDDQIFVTDNRNHIIDVDFGLIDEPEKLAVSLNQIDGLLAHGLFINLTSKIMMVKNGELIIYTKE